MKKIITSLFILLIFTGIASAQVYEVEINFKEFKIKTKKKATKRQNLQ